VALKHIGALTLRAFYSRAFRALNDRVFLQSRPTFCRAGGDDAFYDLIRSNWKINDRLDLVRYYFLHLQIQRLDREKIPGDFAEVGVYKGNTAMLFRKVAPHRRLHLFDTFEGFHPSDSDNQSFKDVTLAEVQQRFGDAARFYPGYFPETTSLLDPQTRFALVHIDVDLEKPIRAGMEYFYYKVSPGGAIIVHDYNNVCSWDHGAKKAVDCFLSDKPERGIEMPDRFGSVLIVKN
jgi:O-methyltransferase